MSNRCKLLALPFALGVLGLGLAGFDGSLDSQLASRLQSLGFTGRMQNQVEERLGRPIDRKMANLGRLLWFDTLTGLNDDNTCGGCHAPNASFGDTQSIAIGIDNNGIVGPHRRGPRNQRRAPSVINNVFYPNLMWNSRFRSNSGSPFDNSLGFTFPPPEGNTLSNQTHLLRAQAFIPPTERVEVAGFSFPGNNDDIRAEVVNRLNASLGYRKEFGKVFSSVKQGGPITYDMFAAATAEFEFTLVFADAPIDKFARGKRNAMTTEMKRGALLFFGEARCVNCHSVSGSSSEMFSDFTTHVAGTPQIMPSDSNMIYDGPGANEDFGLEQITGDPADRYEFRSSPLRNVAYQPAFFHNGSFTSLEKAIRYHLNPRAGALHYSTAPLDPDLRGPMGPIQPVLDRLDPLLETPPNLTEHQIRDLIAFVKYGLTDEKAQPRKLMHLIPSKLPSGRPPLVFEHPR